MCIRDRFWPRFVHKGGEVTQRDARAQVRLSRAELDGMAAAAAVVRGCWRELTTRAGGIAAEILAGAAFEEWRHYPEGEAYDPESHAQFFYHAHPGPGRSAREHGHFHTFMRAEGMPPGAVPLLLPEIAVANAPAPQGAPLKRGNSEEVSHLVAIAVDGRGSPIRLFTTNRWVTGETWYRAEDVIAMVDRFAVGGERPSALLNLWIDAILRLFRPQIAELLQARDKTVMEWRLRRRSPVFEDPRLEIVSSLDIDLDRQLEFVERAEADASITRRPRATLLPSMAEGWDDG